MTKNYPFGHIKNLHVHIRFATEYDPIYKWAGSAKSYYAASQETVGFAVDSIGHKYLKKLDTKYYGTAKDRPWTKEEVGNALKNFNNLNTSLHNDIKTLYLDLINEDMGTK